jgi:mRNA interferase RelE/StbE
LKVCYTPEAASLIQRLHPEIKRLVRQAIQDLLANPLLGHELRMDLAGFRSYQVKGYRVLYQINDRDAFLEVYYVGRRRDVYESFQAFLAEKKPG